jgi:hypothetical protein
MKTRFRGAMPAASARMFQSESTSRGGRIRWKARRKAGAIR